MAPDQLAVHADRRAPSGEPQHGPAFGGRLAVDDLGDAIGEQPDEVVVIRHDDGRETLALAGAFDRSGGPD